MSLSTGEKLGPYEILSPIGAGGMGEVYKARDTRLDRSVAIKVLPEHIAKREDLRARFEREARAVASLNHPNICTLHDIGRHEEKSYMVMELIEGETLAARIEKGALPLDQALKFAIQIADALDRAHRAGVTHRDVKPQNIMLTRDGVKVLDFGLAKSNAKIAPTEATLTAVLTTEGTVMGTPQYMAPEQFEGKEADARSDIWAFGAVLYEMVSGRKAFQGKTYSSLVGAILATDPPPMSLKPFTPAWLERLVRRCLNKDPEERYHCMRDVVLDLRTPPAEASAPAPPKASRWPWVAASLMMVAAMAGGAFWYSGRPTPPAQAVRFRLEFPVGVTVPSEAVPVISPDGGKILIEVGSGPKSQFWIRSLDSPTPRPVPGTEGAYRGIFSPDGRSLAFMHGRELRRIDLSSGASQTLCELSGNVTGPASWNRDGVLLVHHQNVINRIPVSGGAPKPVTELAAGESVHYFANFLPDGRHFLYFVYTGVRTGATNVGSIDDPKFRKQIQKDTGPALYVSPGWLLYAGGNFLLAQSFDPAKLELRGEPAPIADQPGGNARVSGLAFSASETGCVAWRSAADSSIQLAWVDRTGKQLGVVGEPGEITNPVLSADDKRALITIRDPGTRTRDLWILDLVRGTNSRLTFDPAEDFNPVWSPDGVYVYFASSRKGPKNLYRKRADGTGADEELFVSDVDKDVDSLSPDGKLLLYNEVPRAKPHSLWILPLTGDRKPLTFVAGPFYANRGQFSPNGRWIAYMSRESGRDQIYVQSAPGSGAGAGKWQVSIAGGDFPQWRRDGKELFFLAGDKLMAVPVKTEGATFGASTPEFLFTARLGVSPRNHFSIGAGGQRFLFASVRESGEAQLQVLVNWPALLNRK